MNLGDRLSSEMVKLDWL